MPKSNPNIQESSSIWRSYSSVYDLMNDLPFVKALRYRHLRVMREVSLILDAGCGTGLYLSELASHKERNVVGLDLSPSMLKTAAVRLKQSTTVRLINADVHALPFADTTFDGLVSNNVLHCLTNPSQAILEMIRVTRPRGIISIASPRPCLDIDILLDALLSYIKQTGNHIPKADLDLFVKSNKALVNELKNVYEPDDISKILKANGCSDILEEGTTYLGQNFFVAAQR